MKPVRGRYGLAMIPKTEDGEEIEMKRLKKFIIKQIRGRYGVAKI